ncbi:MAG: hypothetical protein CMP59_01260 [Flavobacteriales bacterium]|nr:hypothetical protein [Flavobacteriales bacterium]|tara:strand:+ start:158 stop:811 length:654 start_codon:yes stop_codon:yes gene_type:complete
MAKKTKKYRKVDWIKAYKDYVLQYGETAKDTKSLLDYTEQPFVQFGELFDELQDIEVAVIEDYFNKALKVLDKDKEASKMEVKDQHLAFLYLLMELISKDELFLRIFKRSKRGDASFFVDLQKALNHKELSWAKLKNWRPDFVDDLNINPKRSLLINHAISCMLFSIEDKSKDKQDTDAYIEKTTDLLFKLTDTSTLHSFLDLGKFMYSRGKSKMFS